MKIIIQIKTNITAKCEGTDWHCDHLQQTELKGTHWHCDHLQQTELKGTHWHCDHLQQTKLKASSYDQVQSLNTITGEDTLNIPSCFRLHWTSPCPLGSHKQYRQLKNQPSYLITLANDMLKFGENQGKVKAGRIKIN